MGALACDHRMRVKDFLSKKFGPPMTKNYSGEWINADSKWLAVKTKNDEYVIAVKDPKLRDWLLLL